MKRFVHMATILLAAVALISAGCSKRVVNRVDPDTTIDLSGRWNDTDSRQTADAMIGSLIGGPWLGTFSSGSGKQPAVIAGSIRNKSLEHIAVGAFLKDIELAMIHSGRVQVVASPEEREEIRDERLDQRANASPETIKKMGRELGADSLLIGEINQIHDREGKDEVRYYQVALTLVNIESNVKTWADQKKIKKYISSSRYKP